MLAIRLYSINVTSNLLESCTSWHVPTKTQTREKCGVIAMEEFHVFQFADQGRC